MPHNDKVEGGVGLLKSDSGREVESCCINGNFILTITSFWESRIYFFPLNLCRLHLYL